MFRENKFGIKLYIEQTNDVINILIKNDVINIKYLISWKKWNYSNIHFYSAEKF